MTVINNFISAYVNLETAVKYHLKSFPLEAGTNEHRLPSRAWDSVDSNHCSLQRGTPLAVGYQTSILP